MLFFIKVRIDITQLYELAEALKSGLLDRSALRSTYCLKDDPTVGLNIWEAENEQDLEQRFLPHRRYYAEVMEISPVTTPDVAFQSLVAKLNARSSADVW